MRTLGDDAQTSLPLLDRRQDHQPRTLLPASIAAQPTLERRQRPCPARVGHLIAVERPRGPTARAFDLQAASEAD